MSSQGKNPAGSGSAGKPPETDFIPLHPPEDEPEGMPVAPKTSGSGGSVTPVGPAPHNLPHVAPRPNAPVAPMPAGSGHNRPILPGRPPMVTPPAGLPTQLPPRPPTTPNLGAPPRPGVPPPTGVPASGRSSGAVPVGGTPAQGIPAGRRSGAVPASHTPSSGVNIGRSSGGVNAAPAPAQPASAGVAGTMEAIQLLMAVRGAASKVKQVHVVDQISHGLQSLGIKMPDSKGQLPAMKTPTAAVPASAFIELLLLVLAEAKKAKQFSLAERIRSGLESMGQAIPDHPDHSNIAKRVKP